MEAKVAIFDMLASVDVNKHQFIEDEEAILEVIEVDGDDDDVDEGVEVGAHLEANAGDHDGEGDQDFDGVDVPEEMVDMATCIRNLDICKTIDHMFCNSISYVITDTIHGEMETLCVVCFRLYALRIVILCNVHTRRRTFTGPYGEMERHHCRVCKTGLFLLRPKDVCATCNNV
ncbi:hypothetical protein JTB14_032038 [Gonioctena quinquepunctata]|nr:hypothetical protein JTB14_032038 [Gonioctena quinquepunctata]